MLTRFILKELAKNFLLSLLALTLLLVGLLMAEAKVEYGLGPTTSLRLAQFVLPRALAYSMSAAWLLSVCFVYGSMSMSNELLAVSAAGVSPIRPLVPALVCAAVLTIPTIWLMDQGNSWGKDGIHRIVLASVKDIAYRRLKSDRSYTNKNLSVFVRDIEGDNLIGPKFLSTATGNVVLTASAEVGRLDLDETNHELVVNLNNGVATIRNGGSLRFRDDFTLRVPLREMLDKDLGNNFTLQQLPASIQAQRVRIQQMEKQGIQHKIADATADFGTAEQQRELTKQLEDERYKLFRLRTFQHRRISQGFCCLSFTIFGLPLAILLRGRDLISRFFFSYLPIMLFFYPVEFRLARMASLPPFSLWVCHLVLIVGGCLLWRTMGRR